MVRKKRKTADERSAEKWEADQQAWEYFEPRLSALQTMEDAYKLMADAAPPDSSGRKYFSNLGFFLSSFTVPGGASSKEKRLYVRFVERLDDAGMLVVGARKTIIDSLQASMAGGY
jgi:hypothetical protein